MRCCGGSPRRRGSARPREGLYEDRREVFKGACEKVAGRASLAWNPPVAALIGWCS
ncbi:MAG: hypothetical protein ACO2PN_23305 [Pyrobaculum sp.]